MKYKDIPEFEQAFNVNTKMHKVFRVLEDKKWHCRECEYKHTGITQIAGGSGIQGLQRGSKNRHGMEINSENHLCTACGHTTRQDKWTGNFKESFASSSMPVSFSKIVFNVLGYRDIVDGTSRTPSQLTIDHKLPMLRWNSKEKIEQTNYKEMNDTDIKTKFQLLKKSNGSTSHNLLKSRTCEECWKTGKRGKPFGIVFFYDGGNKWEYDKDDPRGCIGCGQYDFDLWRKTLNKFIKVMHR